MLESQIPLLTKSGGAGESEQSVGFRFSITWSFLFVPQCEPPKADSRSTPLETVVPVHNQVAIDLFSSPSFGTRASGVPKLFFAIAVLTAIAVPVWRHVAPATPKHASAELEMDPRGGGWIREIASSADAGAAQARALNIYQPSLNARDGQFEFVWKADVEGAGWVFRAKDIGNYYAIRIKVLSQAPSLRLSVEHFAVYLGSEGSHAEKVLVLPQKNALLRIRTDVAGPSFTLYLQGSAVDYWNDARLTTGGFGFFEEQHQAPDVRSVRMSLSQGAGMQLERIREIGAVFAMNRLHMLAGKTARASGGA